MKTKKFELTKEIELLLKTTDSERFERISGYEISEVEKNHLFQGFFNEVSEMKKNLKTELVKELEESEIGQKISSLGFSVSISGSNGTKDTSIKGLLYSPETEEYLKSSTIIRIFDLPEKEKLHGITRKQGETESSNLSLELEYLEVPSNSEEYSNSKKFIESEFWKKNEKRIKKSKSFISRLSEKQGI